MVFPVFFITFAGRMFPIIVRAGSALSRFIRENPKIISSTISLQAISAAIQSHESTEKEKIEIVNDIGKENPQLRYDLYRNIFYPHTDMVSNILPYLVILLIVYFLLKK